MNTVFRVLRVGCIVSSCFIAPILGAQAMGLAYFSMSDHMRLASPKQQVMIGNFRLELRPQAMERYEKDPQYFELLAHIASAYAGHLPAQQLRSVQVHDPVEIYDNSTARFPGTIAIGFEDFTFVEENPSAHRAHLVQLFLHEFGHKVAMDATARKTFQTVQEIYFTAKAKTVKGAEWTDPFFAIFTDARYAPAGDTCGHPWDDSGELFASTFMLVLLHPQEVEARIAVVSDPAVREQAAKLVRAMRKTTRQFPKPDRFLVAANAK